MCTLSGDSDIYPTYAYTLSSRALCTNVEIFCDELLGNPCDIVLCCKNFQERRDSEAISTVAAATTYIIQPESIHTKKMSERHRSIITLIVFASAEPHMSRLHCKARSRSGPFISHPHPDRTMHKPSKRPSPPVSDLLSSPGAQFVSALSTVDAEPDPAIILHVIQTGVLYATDRPGNRDELL